MTWQLEVENPLAHDLLDGLGPVALSRFGASVQALFASREEAECACRQLAAHLGLSPALHELEARDWVAWNTRCFASFTVGPFTIVPADDPGEAANPVIRMRAGAGFGTGEHPTTAGCLEALAALPTTPGSVLDMGCGSAILSIAAAVLWDCHVVGVDSDPLALAFARRQVADNGFASRIHLACASGLGAFSATHFDLVVANILARPLIDMAPTIRATTIILSGFLEDQCAWVVDAYRQAGYAPRLTSITDGWVTLTLATEEHPVDPEIATCRRPARTEL